VSFNQSFEKKAFLPMLASLAASALARPIAVTAARAVSGGIGRSLLKTGITEGAGMLAQKAFSAGSRSVAPGAAKGLLG
jgi:hypothetical protein